MRDITCKLCILRNWKMHGTLLVAVGCTPHTTAHWCYCHQAILLLFCMGDKIPSYVYNFIFDTEALVWNIHLYSSSASQLAVSIDVSYTKPSDFSMDPPNYRAGSSITLTCRVEGVTDRLTYSWSSPVYTTVSSGAGPHKMWPGMDCIQWTLVLTHVMQLMSGATVELLQLSWM